MALPDNHAARLSFGIALLASLVCSSTVICSTSAQVRPTDGQVHPSPSNGASSRRKPPKRKVRAKRVSATNRKEPQTSSFFPISFEAITTHPSGTLVIGGAVLKKQGGIDYQGLLVGNADPRFRIRTVPGLSYIWDLAFSAPEIVWAISDGGVLLNSIDNGQHWSKTALTGDHPRLSRVVFVDSSNGWVVGDEGAIYHTENAGVTWDKQDGWTNLHLRRVQFVDTRHGWITGSRMSRIVILRSGVASCWVRTMEAKPGSGCQRAKA